MLYVELRSEPSHIIIKFFNLRYTVELVIVHY